MGFREVDSIFKLTRFTRSDMFMAVAIFWVMFMAVAIFCKVNIVIAVAIILLKVIVPKEGLHCAFAKLLYMGCSSPVLSQAVMSGMT